MPTEVDYQQRIGVYAYPQLLELWGQVQAGETPIAPEFVGG